MRCISNEKNQRKRELQTSWREEENELERGIAQIWFLSDRFLCFHTILLCFPGIIGFLFWWLDVNIGDFCMLLWNLSLLALTIRLISNLFSWLYFWHSRLDFCFETHLRSILAHPQHLSLLINTWNEAYMGSFCSYYSCSVFLFSPIPGTYSKGDTVFSSLPERVRDYKGCIPSPWVWKVVPQPESK